MKIDIIAFGKAKGTEFYGGLQEFEKRIGSSISITELSAVKGDNKDDMLRKEEKILEPYFATNNYKIILDGTGKTFSSQQFSEKLITLSHDYKKLSFFIGSSFGFSEKIKTQANLLLSLSNMTMPHILARLVLIEQIYRAIMINKGHPYHK